MTYIPKPGSIADRALQVLQSGPYQALHLCAALKIKRENLNGNIATAMKAGMIVRELINGRVWFKLAPVAAPQADSQPECATADAATFHACLHLDGELDIYPTLEIDGGGFRLTRDQVDRLCLLLAVQQ